MYVAHLVIIIFYVCFVLFYKSLINHWYIKALGNVQNIEWICLSMRYSVQGFN